MNSEQRVEALEQVVKALAGGNLTVENGQIYINDAVMNDDSIKAANIKAAGFKSHDVSMQLPITR